MDFVFTSSVRGAQTRSTLMDHYHLAFSWVWTMRVYVLVLIA